MLTARRLAPVLLVALSCAKGPTTSPGDAPAGFSSSAQAEASTPPTFESGIERLRVGDPKGAAAILAELTQREPTNGQAWIYRGVAERRAGDAAAAITSFERATELEDVRPQATFQLAISHGQGGDLELAFDYLGQAAHTGKVDITGFAALPGLAALASDPRPLRRQGLPLSSRRLAVAHVHRQGDGRDVRLRRHGARRRGRRRGRRSAADQRLGADPGLAGRAGVRGRRPLVSR